MARLFSYFFLLIATGLKTKTKLEIVKLKQTEVKPRKCYKIS